MRVLITGITGYIGSNLARALVDEHHVFGLVREPVQESYISDIKSKLTLLPYNNSYASMQQAIFESRPDIIYHLAAYYTGAHSETSIPQLIQSNILMGSFLLEAASRLDSAKIIYATTITEFDSKGEYRPLTLYAATKRAFRDLADFYLDIGKLHMITLVLSDTYGPGDLRPKILNRLKKSICTRESIKLSAGDQDYDAVYIDDVVNAFILAGMHLYDHPSIKSACYQVFSDPSIALRQVIHKFLQISNSNPNLIWGQHAVSDRAYKQAIRLFPPVPGWKALVSWDEGLSRFWKDRTTP